MGGVAVFVRSRLSVFSASLPSELEAVCVQLHLPKRKSMYIAAVYRPPSGGLPLTDFVDKLDDVLDNLPGVPMRTLCLVGDFNAKSSSWWDGQVTNDASAALESLAHAHGLVQVVNGPTRCMNNTTPSQLDSMFINNASLAESCSVLSPVADHCPTVLQLRLCPADTVRKCETTLDFSRADWAGLTAFFEDYDWSSVLSCTDVNRALTLWNAAIHSAMSNFVPKVTFVSRSSNKPWYSPLLSRIRRQRDRLFHRSKYLPKDHHLSAAYRKVRNWYLSELRHAEAVYYLQLTARLDLSSSSMDSRWWRSAKCAAGLEVRDSIPPLSVNGKLHLSAADKAECLNASFAAQCSAPSACSSPPLDAFNGEPFAFTEVSSWAVHERLRGLRVGKAAGFDMIGNRVLKECSTTEC